MCKDYIDLIQDEQIKSLTEKALEKYSDEEKKKDAIAVTKILIFILKEDKIYNDNNYSLFVDIVIAAALLHNITYKYGVDDYTNLFKTRQLLNKLNEDEKIYIGSTYMDSLVQPIEGQLGKNHPIALLIPNPNSPGSQFALACSLYYKGKDFLK